MTKAMFRSRFVCAVGSSVTIVAVCSEASQALPTQSLEECPSTSAGSDAPFLGFIENHGQWQADARFVADFGDMLVRAENGGIFLQKEYAGETDRRVAVVRLAFEGAEGVPPEGGERAAGRFHYFLGDDPTRWRSDVPSYAEVVYPSIAPGLTVRLHERDGHCEYDVMFSPSTPVGEFVLRCDGVDELAVEKNGELRMDTQLGPLVQRAPSAWQMTASGEVVPVSCLFRIIDQHRVGFTVPDREVGTALVIDPGLEWATFLGGSGADYATNVSSLPSGEVVVLGRCNSPDFPTTTGAFDTELASADATVTCLDPSGTSILFSTFIGGDQLEVPRALAVSESGGIAIAGYTASTNFPALPNAYDSTSNGTLDAFACVLNPDGTDLQFSTLIGGACNDIAEGVKYTSTGLLVIAGYTCSPTFPMTPGAFDASFGGGADGLVVWLDPAQAGSAQLVASTFLGSAGTDQVATLTIGSGDQPIVAGESTSADFPTTPGAYDETPGGPFVTRFAADGSSLVASTRFKGGHPLSVTEDAGTILISGHSFFADNLPATPGAFDTTWNGKSDGFIASLDGQLGELLAATYIGGSESDSAISLSVDPAGRIVIAGVTSSPDFPTTFGAFDTVYEGPLGTSMVSYLTGDLGELLYSSYLGPATQSSSLANDVAVFGTADVVIVGEGAKSGFPVTPGAFDTTFNGGDIGGADGYVARMLLKPLTWVPVGGAVPGSNGTPQLAGSGNLVGGQPLTLTLTSAKPVTPATLIIGLSLLNAPFKGGTLVPNPSFLIFGLSTNAHGTLALSATWPSGLPSGFTFYTQYWIPDAAGPAGFAASNGLAGTTP